MSGSELARTTIRADKWLWYARFFKTRSLAARVVSGGHLRVNGQRVSKPAHSVGAGDVLTFPQARQIRVIEVVACGERRGPAAEAQDLFVDRIPDQAADDPRRSAGPRPTKKQRRAMQQPGDRDAWSGLR